MKKKESVFNIRYEVLKEMNGNIMNKIYEVLDLYKIIGCMQCVTLAVSIVSMTILIILLNRL